MKYPIDFKTVAYFVIAGFIASVLSGNFAVGIAVFAALLTVFLGKPYMAYIKDNPKHLWFKRKLFGWGWTPVSREGWIVTVVYIVAVLFFGLTLDSDSPRSEVMFTFVIPVTLLTVALIKICIKKGEKPKWQWGSNK
ncbi:MAG: hypothetical protein COV29_03340 [Candidatus Yanofskybacteria bacterium CG10_big_fil_rev_8_21_14_0_10_36_16]|uniref:Uncharacterized protein n=1 Tax=Candidatus Yanofskybacteria bacterium CG10_big_fil_rev_8_21_14_0_10_36_16 TaxID=1975096 RepID=A0A2J0Q757_9BACT|nr:MAG: hypothetical protein COV29_03340 [Candidatus Yanofskybacteria bacterium CG10_big_fil_rev_8_21_14_0_10_36_16]